MLVITKHPPESLHKAPWQEVFSLPPPNSCKQKRTYPCTTIVVHYFMNETPESCQTTRTARLVSGEKQEA